MSAGKLVVLTPPPVPHAASLVSLMSPAATWHAFADGVQLHVHWLLPLVPS